MNAKKRHLLTGTLMAAVFFIYWAAAYLISGEGGFIVPGIVLSLFIFAISYITTPVTERIMAITSPMKTYKKIMAYCMMVGACFLAFIAFYAGMSYIAMYARGLGEYAEALTPTLFMLFLGALLLITFMTPVIHTILYTLIQYVMGGEG